MSAVELSEIFISNSQPQYQASVFVGPVLNFRGEQENYTELSIYTEGLDIWSYLRLKLARYRWFFSSLRHSIEDHDLRTIAYASSQLLKILEEQYLSGNP